MLGLGLSRHRTPSVQDSLEIRCYPAVVPVAASVSSGN
jgi:hypothetical protein